jgi:hypothetical protein
MRFFTRAQLNVTRRSPAGFKGGESAGRLRLEGMCARQVGSDMSLVSKRPERRVANKGTEQHGGS